MGSECATMTEDVGVQHKSTTDISISKKHIHLIKKRKGQHTFNGAKSNICLCDGWDAKYKRSKQFYVSFIRLWTTFLLIPLEIRAAFNLDRYTWLDNFPGGVLKHAPM